MSMCPLLWVARGAVAPWGPAWIWCLVASHGFTVVLTIVTIFSNWFPVAF